MLLIDTNVLVLLVVGCTRRNLIKRHARSKVYSEEDFDLLTELIGDMRRLVLTPHVLTETSGLIADYRDPDRSAIRETLRSFIRMYQEHVEPALQSSNLANFIRLGLTDAALTFEATRQIPLLTDDLDLHDSAIALGLDSTYFFYERIRAGTLEV